MTQRLFIVSEVFYPDQTSTAYIMTQIASELCRKQNVEVICGPEEYSNSNIEGSADDLAHLKISRVSGRNWDKNKLGARLIRLASISVKLALTVFKKCKKGDKVVLVTNPAPLLVLVALISRLKGLRLIIIVHDVFPENIVAAGILKVDSGIVSLLKKVFNKAYSQADQLIVLGRDMKELIQDKVSSSGRFPTVAVIENWADTQNVYPIKKDLEGNVRLQFAGNFGRVQGLMSFLECIRNSENLGLNVDFIGDGAVETEMKSFCSFHNLTSVNILPPFKRSQQLAVLNNCDIGVVSLAKGMKGLGVPSKTYNILAAGKPVLYIGDEGSEIYCLIKEENVGWCFSDYNGDLVQFLKELNINKIDEIRQKGERARNLALKRFAKESILNAYSKAILSI